MSVLDLDIDRQRNKKAVRHRIDEGRALFDRELFALKDIAECPRWHCLEPFRDALHGRYRPWQYGFELWRTPEGNHGTCCLVHQALTCWQHGLRRAPDWSTAPVVLNSRPRSDK